MLTFQFQKLKRILYLIQFHKKTKKKFGKFWLNGLNLFGKKAILREDLTNSSKDKVKITFEEDKINK